MLRAGAELVRQAVGLIYPPACLVCDTVPVDPSALRHGLCKGCYHAITVDPFAACSRCAQTIGPFSDTTNGCVECRGTKFAFERALRLGPYDEKRRDAVLRMKFLDGEGLSDLLGRAFAESRRDTLLALRTDMVAPIPLHWWRRWTRGYNQSESVARELAAGIGVAFAPHVLRRVRYTTQQTQPTRTARVANMKGAFRVTRGARLSGRTVLLVDDVMTTGTTATEAALTLLAAGATRVAVAVIARR